MTSLHKGHLYSFCWFFDWNQDAQQCRWKMWAQMGILDTSSWSKNSSKQITHSFWSNASIIVFCALSNLISSMCAKKSLICLSCSLWSLTRFSLILCLSYSLSWFLWSPKISSILSISSSRISLSRCWCYLSSPRLISESPKSNWFPPFGLIRFWVTLPSKFCNICSVFFCMMHLKMMIKQEINKVKISIIRKAFCELKRLFPASFCSIMKSWKVPL